MATQKLDWLDQMSTPVQNGKALPDGSVVFNLPPNPADVAKEEREAAKEDRALAEKTFRTMTTEEKIAQGLPVEGIYQINDLNEIKTIQDAPKAEKGAVNKEQAAANVARQLTDLRQIFNRSFAGQGPFQSLSEFLPSEDRQKFQAIVRTMRADLKPLIRGPAEGTFTEGDQKLLDELLPDPDRFDAYNEQIFSEIENRVKGVLGEFPTTPAPTPAAPPRTEVSGTGDFLTPEDQRLQSELTSAYNAGASLQELQAISAKYNRPFPIGSQEELDAARAQGRGIAVQASGRRSAAMEALGQVADTAVGAGMVAASNALLSGTMDELAPLIGADPATVQAAKDYLREKYPVASFTGEVAGQVGQLAAGGAGLRALGAGARTLAGAEIAQGAASGAGEANENRLAGAALGAGGVFVGQQIASRLLGNAAGRETIDRIAQETGEAPEVIAREIGEAVEAGQARTAQAAPSEFPQATVPGAVETVTPTPGAEEVTDVIRLAEAASGRGAKAVDAQKQLAIIAKINPEAKAAADRLGIEVPLDVLSDDTRLLTATGLARSQPSSVAETEWLDVTKRVIEEADDTLSQIGGSRDLSQLSLDVRTRLQSNMDTLKNTAEALRKEVVAVINPSDRVQPDNLRAVFARLLPELGGVKDAKQVLTGEEKRLLTALGDNLDKTPTYGYLERLRQDLGDAMEGKGPWKDVGQKARDEYYAALAKDRLAYVESVGGQELADKMRLSNDNFSKMYDVRKAAQAVFGAQLQNDIAGVVRNAITQGGKGEGKALRTVLNNVPEDMQSRALITALMAEAGKGGNSIYGGFSFKNYASLYRNLRQNSAIYAEVAKTIGKEKAQVLQDLYALSTRMAAAEAKVIKTGKANNPVLNALRAEGLVSQIAKGSIRAGGRVAGGVAGGAVGGPLGAVGGQEAGARIADALVDAGKNELEQMHTLLSSEGFRDLVVKISAGEDVDKAINRAANDGPFRRFSKTALNLKTAAERQNWLRNAIKATPAAGAVSQARSEDQSPATIEVR